MPNSLYYHKGKKECDFVLAENHQVMSLIQVTWSINDP